MSEQNYNDNPDHYNDGPPDFDVDAPPMAQEWAAELSESCVSLSLSPKGKILAVATVDDDIAVLDVGSGEVKWRLAGHAGGTNRVAFLGGNTLLSCGEDGKVKVWNVGRQALLQELDVAAEDGDRTRAGVCVSHLAVSPDGLRFAAAAGRSVTLFTLPPGQPGAAPMVEEYPALPSSVESLRMDGGGNLLASYYGGVTLWDLRRSEEAKQGLDLPYDGACLSADVSPGLDWVVAGCHDSSVHIFHLLRVARDRDGDAGVELQEMTCGGYSTKVTRVDFSPEGRWLASSGGDRCTVWDFKDSPAGTVPTLTVGHRGNITCQGWQPDGDFLATGGKDGVVFVYDLADAMPGTPNICLPGVRAGEAGGDALTELVWGLDGVLFTGHLSGFVRRWQIPVAPEGGEAAAAGR